MDNKSLKEKSIQELQLLLLENLTQIQATLHELCNVCMEQQKELLEQIVKNTNVHFVAV